LVGNSAKDEGMALGQRKHAVGDLAPVAPVPGCLRMLRRPAQDTRTAPRCTPWAACSLLDPRAPARAYSDALARVLPEMTLRRPVIWLDGVDKLTFDEDWLVACRECLRRGDVDSFCFLTARRLRPGMAPMLRLLLEGLDARLAA
jgi:hypothetical protein